MVPTRPPARNRLFILLSAQALSAAAALALFKLRSAAAGAKLRDLDEARHYPARPDPPCSHRGEQRRWRPRAPSPCIPSDGARGGGPLRGSRRRSLGERRSRLDGEESGRASSVVGGTPPPPSPPPPPPPPRRGSHAGVLALGREPWLKARGRPPRRQSRKAMPAQGRRRRRGGGAGRRPAARLRPPPSTPRGPASRPRGPTRAGKLRRRLPPARVPAASL
ncbi:hypothetical protein SEVIR_7G094651v4 [Setaria viridis]